MAQIDDSFMMEGYEEQLKQLKQMMTNDPTFRRRINEVIRKVLREARTAVSKDFKQIIGSDPRNAYKAVRHSVYKRIFGGQLNILQRRKAGSPGNYQKPQKGLPKRGGNRWGRSDRTAALEGYEGADRGFVLRFINNGAQNRSIHSYSDRNGMKHDLRSGRGSRGSIVGSNWFGIYSQAELEKKSKEMQELIDKIIAQEFV